MDVQINQMNSTIHATDSQALLTPELMRQITQSVLAALKEQEGYERRLMQERQIRSSSTPQSHTWE